MTMANQIRTCLDTALTAQQVPDKAALSAADLRHPAGHRKTRAKRRSALFMEQATAGQNAAHNAKKHLNTAGVALLAIRDQQQSAPQDMEHFEIAFRKIAQALAIVASQMGDRTHDLWVNRKLKALYEIVKPEDR